MAPVTPEAGRPDTWAIDLDGVVWLTGVLIPGADAAVTRLRAAGIRPLFATNNSAPTDDELVARLANIGIAASIDDIVTSAHAAASLVEPGRRVLAVGEEGLRAALVERGCALVEEGPADVVVVGWTHGFDFDQLAEAARTVRGGARLVGTNDDPTHPTPHGLMPGAGSLLAAVATAAGVVPTVAGKPNEPMAALIGSRAGSVAMVVGDRPSTDGLMARRLGAPFALVLSGVTAKGDGTGDPPASVVADDLAALVDVQLSARR
jgi:4-nitrophenyl phosphatase